MMRKLGISACVIMLTLFLSVALSFGWGGDVQIYSGQINTFDVDYDLDTGSMFVAFQTTGEDIIRLYASTDHGTSWSEVTTFNTDGFMGTTPRTDLSCIRVIYNAGRVHIFWVDSLGFLNRSRCSSTGAAKGASRVSAAAVPEGSFSVTLDLESGRLYVGWRTGTGALARQIIRFSDDNGITWTDRINWSAAYTGSLTQNLAYGPGGVSNHIYWAFGTEQFGTPEELQYLRFPSCCGGWDQSGQITSNVYANYDPRVAAANVDDSGVWILYNRDRGGHEIDLMHSYSPDAGVTWSIQDSPIDTDDGIDEYIADVKFYKDYPNSYVNMVYIKDDPAADPVRQAIWMYASTGDPSWRGAVVFSDEDVQSWPEETAPRIVYSPGAGASGGGSVFSYFGANGLYFDAPWISGYTLTVTIHGSGSVVSSPSGIDCTHNVLIGDEVCTYEFTPGTAVALTATPIDGVDYTSSFIEWSGDCSGSVACPVVMNSDIFVEASFGALGIPVFALGVPAGQEAWSYSPVESPMKQPDPADCRPFAIGDVSSGNVNLQIGLPPFSGGVDIYLALQSDAVDPNTLYMIDDCNVVQPASTVLPPWKTSVSFTDIDESLWGDIPLSALPSGLYNLYIAVTPTGETDFSHYYFWATYFVAP
jgi:hypothetical protein